MKLENAIENAESTDPAAASAYPAVNEGRRPTFKPRADNAAAPTATPIVPVVPGIPDRLVDPVICSDINVDTVTIPMYAVDAVAFPANRVHVSRLRVRLCRSVSMAPA